MTGKNDERQPQGKKTTRRRKEEGKARKKAQKSSLPQGLSNTVIDLSSIQMMSPSNLGLGLFLVIISIAVASKQFQKSFQETFLLKSLSELPLDENGRLQDNWLLYLDNPLCKQLAEDAWEKVEPAHRRVASVTSELALIYFPDEDPTTISHCSSIVLYKGMRSDYVQHVLPKDKLIITSDSSPTAFSEFLMDRSRAEVGWVSHSDRKMSIFWLDPTTGYRVLNGELMYGEKHTVW